jgi:hypothetical protein
MEQHRFEAALRALNGETSRRRGVAALLGALAAGTTSTSGVRGAETAGACGTSPQENACRQNSDCCTGLCRIKPNGKGRCICRKVGKPCSSSKNCCSEGGEPMTCKSGTCLLI